MPYVVSYLFGRCDELHGLHFRLEDAANCFDKLTRRFEDAIPIHPISGKYTYAIIAIDGNGDQRDFSKKEQKLRLSLGLDIKSVYLETPGIATFYQLSHLYVPALRLIPSLSVDLEGLFDPESNTRHFWNTDAGRGQALAYIQQSVFTLELALKALLEIQETMAEHNIQNKNDWQTHDLAEIFSLLPEDDKSILERRWGALPLGKRQFNGTFSEFLTCIRNSYMEWRYITDLKSTNLMMNIGTLSVASEIVLDVASKSLRKRSPIKVTTKTSVVRNTDEERSPPHEVVIEGIARKVNVPDSFDPQSEVEVVIDSDHHDCAVTALFRKRDVERYFNIVGKRVLLAGYSREDEPQLLMSPTHIDGVDRFSQLPTYAYEYRMLKGSAYNFSTFERSHLLATVNLILFDETYFTKVDCHFSTEEERRLLQGVQLGDELLIGGLVTLLNGIPLLLIGPEFVKKVEVQKSIS